MDGIFEIEREINGLPTAQRLAVRVEKIVPLMADLENWMRLERAKLSRHAPLAKAFDYMLTRWNGFAAFLADGRICATNNCAERALRGLAMRESLCPSSLSICKHWKRVGVNNATRATFTGHRRLHWFRRQVIGPYLMGRARNNLHVPQNLCFNQAPDRMVCDA